MEIEEVAHTNPDAVAQDLDRPGHRGGRGEGRARSPQAAKYPADVIDAVVPEIVKLYDVFIAEDASLVEVNPLVKLEDGNVEALDGKVTLDENADFRHPDHAEFEDIVGGRPAGGRGQGQGPELRQARRLGRHHRQRRRPGHVHARRRRVRR